MELKTALFKYVLRLGDNALILGHRLSEWCGHGPAMEIDIGLTNIALDLMGQAKSLLDYAAEVEGEGRTSDDLAFLRTDREFTNVLLVEQPNEDFAYTITRQFLFDTFNYLFFKSLAGSKDEQLAAIAQKSIKEIAYHYRYSAEWMIRLGDGTALSHEKIQEALDELWMYRGELMLIDEVDELLLKEGIGVDLNQIKEEYDKRVSAVLAEATLVAPEHNIVQKGGKQGIHTEFLGFILAELQYMQRAYPNMQW